MPVDVTDQGIANMDSNGDGTVNILDVVGCVNIILDFGMRKSGRKTKELVNILDKASRISNNGNDVRWLQDIYHAITGEHIIVDNPTEAMHKRISVRDLGSTKIMKRQHADKWLKKLKKSRSNLSSKIFPKIIGGKRNKNGSS